MRHVRTNPVMKILLVVLLTFSKAHIRAQDNWTVTHLKKELLQASTEDTAANRVVLKYGDLKKWGALQLTYQEIPQRAGWKRTVFFIDDAQNEVATAHGNKFLFRNRKLRHAAKHARRLYVYTSTLPMDPDVAATVRVRRVHLCTLILED